jgi:sulfur-carrier protein adenylyltransferase/sulfurtransferase
MLRAGFRFSAPAHPPPPLVAGLRPRLGIYFHQSECYVYVRVWEMANLQRGYPATKGEGVLRPVGDQLSTRLRQTGGGLPAIVEAGCCNAELTSWKLRGDRSGFDAETIEIRRSMPSLSRDEISRYSRHLIMPEVGMEGQLKLKSGRVLIIGAGGLGSPLSLYLAAAGVGALGLVDFDKVELTNLQRQILHSTDSIGRSKLDSARERLLELNPEVKIETHDTRLTSENALDILRKYDVIVDGTDNFPTRYLVNDACVLLGKPNVYGSIFRFEGQASVFGAPEGPCYRCLFPEPPPPGFVPSCAEGGVLGVLPGIIGVVQATEAVKLLLGIGEPLVGRLLVYDALRMNFRELELRKDPACPICGPNRTIHELIDYEEFCGVAARPDTPIPDGNEIEPLELKDLLDRQLPILVLDVREPYEWQVCRIPGATLIPLGQLPSRTEELGAAQDIVVYCHSGVRSRRAVELLRAEGFPGVRNLRGGILAWADQVDPSMPRY